MAAAEPHLVTPGGALGDDAAPPDVRLVPGDAEDEEYEEPDPPLRPSAHGPAQTHVRSIFVSVAPCAFTTQPNAPLPG